jgi:four helix bundle protein
VADLPYRNLKVWQAAVEIAGEVVELAAERRWRSYLRDQACRAAWSVAANIAEGNGRSTPLDYASYIDRARGSLYELDTWLLAAVRERVLRDEERSALELRIKDLSVRLNNLANALRARTHLPSRG